MTSLTPARPWSHALRVRWTNARDRLAVGAVGAATGRLGATAGLAAGFRAAGGQMGDALQGVGRVRAGEIAQGLEGRAVRGWGAGTVGGRFANRVRTAAANPAGTAGTPDSLGGGSAPGAPGPRAMEERPVGRGAEVLRRMAGSRPPSDGHAGGISIRLHHPD